MKEKAFLSILNKKFPGGACPRTPLAAWALQAQVTHPKGVYIRVTPVTNKATAVQNSTENPVYVTSFFFKCVGQGSQKKVASFSILTVYN